MNSQNSFQKVPGKNLFVSEPDPSWFGNDQNEKNNKNWNNGNWLKSRFHFSFAEYQNGPQQFGVLRVLNDDLVQPNRGFGTHPHANMEICTYVVEGKLSHQDSMGTQETLERHSIQFMTAGQGVRHSEHNLDKSTPLRFIQIWIVPRQRELKPNYGSYRGTQQEMNNKFLHLVSDVANKNIQTPVKINQDCNIFVSEFDKEVQFDLSEDRMAYVLCMEGKVTVNGAHCTEELETYDASRVYGKNELKFIPKEGKVHLMILEMKKVNL